MYIIEYYDLNGKLVCYEGVYTLTEADNKVARTPKSIKVEIKNGRV